MTVQERLEFYKNMLIDFKAMNEGNFYNACNGKNIYSLCYYVYANYAKENLFHLAFSFPELWQSKPDKIYRNSGYWFSSKDKKSRIECIKKAIEITEQKIQEV